MGDRSAFTSIDSAEGRWQAAEGDRVKSSANWHRAAMQLPPGKGAPMHVSQGTDATSVRERQSIAIAERREG